MTRIKILKKKFLAEVIILSCAVIFFVVLLWSCVYWQVLVHGEQNEMSRLKAALIREYEDDTEYQMNVHNPKNTVAVELHFRGEKMAKVYRHIST